MKPRATWDTGASLIRLSFPYSAATVTKIRTLKGAKFIRKPTPHWAVKYSGETVQKLREWGFGMASPKLMDLGLPKYTPVRKILKRLKFLAPLMPEDFQKYGVAFIESRKGRAILADQMRVGKSVQSLLWIKECSPATTLITCKAANKETWRREVLKWIPDANIYVVSGRYERGDVLPDADFYIVNYEIIAVKRIVDKKEKVYFRRDLVNKNPQNLVIDECHHVCNMTALRTKAIRRLKNVPYIIPLSGTPLDKPVQFYVALNLVAPNLFPSYKDYVERYCGPKMGKDGKMNYDGASNIEELHHIIKSTVLLRRTRKQVLPNLPGVKPIVIPLPLSSRKNYQMAEQGAVDKLNYIFGDEEWEVNTKSRNVLERLKQAVMAEKLEACLEWIKSTLEEEEKLIIFTTHTKTVDILKSNLSKYKPVVLDGRTSEKEKGKAEDKFSQDPNCRLFIGNIKACKEGLDLSVADVSCSVELAWSPNDHDQAGDRVVHIHKKQARLLSYFLIAEGTIEETIIKILDRKRQVISKLMEGQEAEDTELLTELLAKLRKYNR